MKNVLVGVRSSACLVAVFGLASCLGARIDTLGDPIQFPRTIVDEIGFEIRQREKPDKIASSVLMGDEILLDLVGPEKLVTVSVRSIDPTISNLPEEAARVPLQITQDMDRVIEQNPDIAFLPSWTGAMTIAKLRSEGVPSYYSDPPVSIDQIQAKVRGFAFAVGEPEKGEELIRRMDEVLLEVSQTVDTVSQSDRRSVVYYNPVALRALGAGTLWSEVVERAGLVNAAGEAETNEYGDVYATWDDIAKLDPDIIILPGRIADDAAKARAYFDEAMASPEVQELRAHGDGNILMADERHLSAQSHYVALGVRDLAQIAYPDLFE